MRKQTNNWPWAGFKQAKKERKKTATVSWRTKQNEEVGDHIQETSFGI